MPHAEMPIRGRGRPRSTACHQAILRSTVTLLERQPYSAVTIEGIAEHAGVAKQTIYNWWPSKAKLAMEAWTARIQAALPFPDTGDSERDLLLMMERVCELLSHPSMGHTMAGLIADAQSDPELAVEFRESYIVPRRRAAALIIERGMARGELRADIDPQLILDLLYGPVWYRLLLRNAPLDAKFAHEIVSKVLPSLKAEKSAPKNVAVVAVRKSSSTR